MRTDAVAGAGRAAAEALMTDTCRIERTGPVRTGEDGQDATPVIVLYEGRCRLKPAGTAAVSPSATAPAEIWQYKLSIPYNFAARIRAFDAVVMTTSQDPTLADLRLQVRNIDRGTHISARRMWCMEVSR